MDKRRKVFLSLIFTITITAASYAAKWESFTFGEDVGFSLTELEKYCQAHGLKAEEVLWANNINLSSDIKPGYSIFLPVTQTELLEISHHKDERVATGLVPVIGASAAKKALESRPKPEPAPDPVTTADEFKQELNEIKALEDENKDIQSEFDKLTKNLPAPQTPSTPEPSQKVTASEKPKPAQTAQAKPDKVIAAPKNDKQEVKDLADPIIVLSPNGDPATSPMRLIISGDKVEVVELPPDALPKRPSTADLNKSYGGDLNYLLPHYNLTSLPRNNPILNIEKNLSGKMLWPVDGKVSSYFGWRGKRKHEGIDIPMPAGTPIRAARNGVVSRTGNNGTPGFRGYGNFVLLDHGGGLQTFYAHCLSVAVVPGQRIMQGQILAYVGNTGRSTGNHLHFEVRVNNVKVNPIPYLAGNEHLASHK